jgi:hypothetical protein
MSTKKKKPITKINLAWRSILHILTGQSAAGGHSGMKTKSASPISAATRPKYLQIPPHHIFLGLQFWGLAHSSGVTQSFYILMLLRGSKSQTGGTGGGFKILLEVSLACSNFLQILSGQSCEWGDSGMNMKSASVHDAATHAKYLWTFRVCARG